MPDTIAITPGTISLPSRQRRIALLSRIDDWLTAPDEHQVVTLHGGDDTTTCAACGTVYTPIWLLVKRAPDWFYGFVSIKAIPQDFLRRGGWARCPACLHIVLAELTHVVNRDGKHRLLNEEDLETLLGLD